MVLCLRLLEGSVHGFLSVWFLLTASGFDEGICEIICVAVGFMELGQVIPTPKDPTPCTFHFHFFL